MLDSLPFETRGTARGGRNHPSSSPMAVETYRPARHPDATRHGMHPARQQQHHRRHHDNLVHPNGRSNVLCCRSQDDAFRHQGPRRCLREGPAAAGERRVRRPGDPTPRLQAGRPAACAVRGMPDTRPSQSVRPERGAPSLPSACQRHRLTCRRRYTSGTHRAGRQRSAAGTGGHHRFQGTRGQRAYRATTSVPCGQRTGVRVSPPMPS